MNDVAQGPVPDCEILPQEMTWPLRHLSLAGLHWPAAVENPEPPIVMVHGWLDNAMSFARLAPLLAVDRDVYAIDLAGHGRSGHRPHGQGYPLTDYIADLAELIETYFQKHEGGSQPDLVGHSLGGIIALFYAAAFPERVRRLALIDSLGPLTREPAEVIPQMRKAITKRLAGSGNPVTYASIEEAARAREGGMIPLSRQAAMTLIPRNLREIRGGYGWSTDPQLRHPSMIMMDEAQVLGCLGQVKTPTRYIRAEKGLLIKREGINARAEAIAGLELVTVPGGHHCHLDGDVQPVASAVREFINVC
ncbi:alpha/beta hydrolase [Marinobacter confluentis]|uniref:Alpha/beta hydrolase n=2 Tax=Marinobacter confluentis TaxID=1697557 RepID=A0A4Z1CBU9_9GAMM|nr:alpha/beta hydrolase [Marinobacter confluentis]